MAITHILSGTPFKVEEVNLNSNDYGAPEYKVEKATVKENPEVAEGTIQLGYNAQVTVTNTLANVAELVIKKLMQKVRFYQEQNLLLHLRLMNLKLIQQHPVKTES